MRVSTLGGLLLLTSLLTACADDGTLDGEAADIQGDEEKTDGTQGIEVTARVKPGSVDAVLSTKVPRRGYVFYAAEGTKVSLETTQGGSSSGLDTVIKVYGPRLADGSYPKTLATDEDAGYGKLSKVSGLAISIPGFYLAEVSFGANATVADGKKTRLKLTCDGTCESALPIDTDLGLKWYRRSAERRALAAQAYRIAKEKLEAKVAAGITGSWGVVLDIDETTLNNSLYQHERMSTAQSRTHAGSRLREHPLHRYMLSARRTNGGRTSDFSSDDRDVITARAISTPVRFVSRSGSSPSPVRPLRGTITRGDLPTDREQKLPST